MLIKDGIGIFLDDDRVAPQYLLGSLGRPLEDCVRPPPTRREGDQRACNYQQGHKAREA